MVLHICRGAVKQEEQERTGKTRFERNGDRWESLRRAAYCFGKAMIGSMKGSEGINPVQTKDQHTNQEEVKDDG